MNEQTNERPNERRNDWMYEWMNHPGERKYNRRTRCDSLPAEIVFKQPMFETRSTCVFLFVIRNNQGPISYRFRDNRRFWSKIAIFFQPGHLSPTRRGLLKLLMAVALGAKTKNDAPARCWKKLAIYSRLDTIPEFYRQTNWHTEGMVTQHRAVYSVRYACWRAIKMKQTKNKSITSEAMHYWQDIVTRMPTTRVELMTPKSNHRKYLAQVCGRFFLRFGKFPPQICESCGSIFYQNSW